MSRASSRAQPPIHAMPAPSELPSHVTVFVNWLCNLRCRQCWLYGDSMQENDWLESAMRDELPAATFARLVDELLGWRGKTSISLMGGEPLLHRELANMVSRLKSLSPSSYVDVSTNGTTLHKDAETLLRSGIDQIYVSLDGSSAEANDPVRGAGSFARTMRGLQRCLALRDSFPATRVSLNFTLTALNYRDLPRIAMLADRLGVSELSVNFAMFYSEQEGASAASRFESALNRPFRAWRGFLNSEMAAEVDAAALKQALDEAYRCCGTTRLLIAPQRYNTAARATYFSPEWKSKVAERTCPRVFFQTTLLPNGDIVSCTPFADTVMGNLNQSSLREIWQGPRYDRIRLMLQDGLTDVCQRCCDLNNDMDLDPGIFLRARAQAAH